MSDGASEDSVSERPRPVPLTGTVDLRERRTMLSIGLLLSGAVLLAYRALLDFEPVLIRQTVGGAEGFLFEPTGGSPKLIFGVTAWMLWSRRSQLAAALGAPATISSPALLVAGTLLACWAVTTSATDLLIPSLTLLLLGSAGFLAGNAGARAIRRPALFLLFAVPVPSVLVNAVIWPLQIFTSKASFAALTLLQIDATRTGDLIYALDRIFHVIETCGGLRVMITLTFSAVIYAELFRRSQLQLWLLVLLAPLLGVIVNVARVMTIILNPYSEVSAIHTAQGILMVVVAVLALAGVDRVLCRLLGDKAMLKPRLRARRQPGGGERSRLRIAVVALALSIVGIAPHVVPRWRPAVTVEPSIYRLPLRAGDWTSSATGVDKRFFGSVGFTERFSRTYENGADRVDLFVGLNRRLEREGSMLSAKTMIPSAGWHVTESGRIAIAPDGREVNFAIVEFRGVQELVVHWYEGMASLFVETVRAFLALDQSPLRREGHALVVRASTALAKGPTARDDALARIERLLPLIRRQLESI